MSRLETTKMVLLFILVISAGTLMLGFLIPYLIDLGTLSTSTTGASHARH